MRNLVIIACTLIVVVAMAFLPEVLLKRGTKPEIKMDYQQVTITAQTSSDYAWRMERIGEHYFGEAEHILMTYISEVEPSEDGSQAHRLFTNELNRLIALGAVPSNVGQQLTDSLDYRIRYYYLFDSEAVAGFRIAEFVAAGTNWNVSLCLDVESGKLAKVQYGGSLLIPSGSASPLGNSSWYDMLRHYGDYLGLSTALSHTPEQPQQTARNYFDSCTADRLAAKVGNTASWLELRAIRENYKMTLAAYTGGI